MESAPTKQEEESYLFRRPCGRHGNCLLADLDLYWERFPFFLNGFGGIHPLTIGVISSGFVPESLGSFLSSAIPQ